MAYVGSSGTNGAARPGIAPGLLSQNNADIYYFPHRFYKDNQGSGTQTPDYFADPDGIVRRGMGAMCLSATVLRRKGHPFLPIQPSASLGEGFCCKQSHYYGLPGYRADERGSHESGQSRPYFLHRPFYSVAELGYVFSDTPCGISTFSPPKAAIPLARCLLYQ